MSRIIRALTFTMMVGFLVVGLKVCDWLPNTFQPKRIRYYTSISAVRLALPEVKISLPAYFPKEFQWPPAEILAASKPYKVILLHFKESQSGEFGMAIRHTDNPDCEPHARIRPGREIKRSKIKLKGYDADLVLAHCTDGRICNRVHWESGGYSHCVTGHLDVRHLTKIAESMIHDSDGQ